MTLDENPHGLFDAPVLALGPGEELAVLTPRAGRCQAVRLDPGDDRDRLTVEHDEGLDAGEGLAEPGERVGGLCHYTATPVRSSARETIVRETLSARATSVFVAPPA